MLRILLLEDDILLNNIINNYLLKNNYIVDSFFDGKDALDNFYNSKYNILILDINVPNINGIDFLKEIRNSLITVPVIFITSMTQLKFMKSCFDIGCDHYIVKPFEIEELNIKLDHIKSTYKLDIKYLNITNDLSYDYSKLQVYSKLENRYITLSKKESQVLEYFIKYPNKTISIDELSYNIWNIDHIPNESTIRSYIKVIRKKIPSLNISNIKGVGYCFNKI